MRFRYLGLHAMAAPRFGRLAFLAMVLAGLALIGTALVMAPAVVR